jgi:membrane-bound serine protease (ClpP class)
MGGHQGDHARDRFAAGGTLIPQRRLSRGGAARWGACFLNARYLALFSVLALTAFPRVTRAGHVDCIIVDGTINPAVADFIGESIDRAHGDGATALIIELDTPGGLLSSTKSIVKDILGAPLPVMVYVAPSGAGAGSAGVFITLAAHVAAMASGTNIGAAHPVAGGGQDIGGDMREKLENFTASFSETIAQKRGRNTDWAARAVRESVSITEREALEKGVIDYVATSVDDLLRQAEGKEVDVDGTEVKLAFGAVRDAAGHARVVMLEMRLKDKVLNILADPNVAGLLMMAALAGLYFEFSNPGLVLPGVIGAISLLLALMAFQVLPINYTGLVLILLGILFILGEFFVPSGFLGVGGAAAFVLGAIFLFDTPEADLMIDRGVIYTVGAFVLVTMALLMRALGSALRRGPLLGAEGLIGEIGEVNSWSSTGGVVNVHGENWAAQSTEPLSAGERVEVVGVGQRLQLRVRRTGRETQG